VIAKAEELCGLDTDRLLWMWHGGGIKAVS